MRTFYKISLRLAVCVTIALMIGWSSCNNFEDINTNPDGAVKVTSGMLATKLILPILANTSTHHRFTKYMVTTEQNAGNMDVQYNALRRYDFDDIAPLRNVEKMINSAPEGALKNSYTALGHFIRCYAFFNHTMRMGDIPYSEALKGEEGNYYPKYDPQKDIFIGILNELDEADRLFAAGATFDGDPYDYKGDPAKWRKLVNVFELRVLMNLLKRADDTPELKVRERFTDIVTKRPLFASNADNCMMVWNDIHRFGYYYQSDNGTNGRYMTTLIVDTLKKFKDYRLFYFARPIPAKIAAGVGVNSYDAYAGIDPTPKVEAGGAENRASKVNERYTDRVEGEPTHIVTSYMEQCFILAEAVVRGFVTGDAKAYYEAGIRASMQHTTDFTPDEERFHHNMKITDNYVKQYLASADVAFSGNPAKQIRQIMIQKYIAGFLRSGDLSWYENRRTGCPGFPIDPTTNLNLPSDKMPVRWMYPEVEHSYNTESVKEALARQFGGIDDNNGLMWILK